MTSEEAIKRLKSDIYKYSDFTENPNENEFWIAFDVAVKALEQTRWIPVSERLPKASEIVLLSLPPRIEPNGEECSASVICGHYIGGKNAEWGLSDGETFGYGIVSARKGINPIAWMPLPEPYKAESEE